MTTEDEATKASAADVAAGTLADQTGIAIPKACDEATWKNQVKAFIDHTTKSMDAARVCAESALLHFEQHGDVSRCQQFLDAMNEHGKNYVRQAAYKIWLREHSPITMESGKFKKDKKDTANKFNLEAALAKPFWEFAPDTEQVSFEANDVVVALQRVIKKFENETKYKPKDEKAVAELAAARTAIVQLQQKAVA